MKAFSSTSTPKSSDKQVLFDGGKPDTGQKDDFELSVLWGLLKYKGKYNRQAIVILLIVAVLIVIILRGGGLAT